MRRRDVLLKKIESAEERYKQEDELVKSAWNTYGSELSGDVGNKANTIASEIKHFEALFEMPEVDMNSEALTVRLDDIERNIIRIQEEIDGLEKEKLELLKKKEGKEALSACVAELKAIPLEE